MTELLEKLRVLRSSRLGGIGFCTFYFLLKSCRKWLYVRPIIEVLKSDEWNVLADSKATFCAFFVKISRTYWLNCALRGVLSFTGPQLISWKQISVTLKTVQLHKKGSNLWKLPIIPTRKVCNCSVNIPNLPDCNFSTGLRYTTLQLLIYKYKNSQWGFPIQYTWSINKTYFQVKEIRVIKGWFIYDATGNFQSS